MVHIIQAGIKKVVAPENYDERWSESFDLANAYAHEAGVEVVIYPPLPHHIGL